MRLGPITIRWTKDVEAEEAKRNTSNAIRNKMVAKLLQQNSQYRAILHRWGLDAGLLGVGASQRSMPPKGAVGVL